MFILKIRNKVLTIILISLVIAILAVYTIAKVHVLGNVKFQEETSVIENVKRIKYIIDMDKQDLNFITGDWAPWDDTLKFVKTNNLDYVKSNLSDDDTFNNFKINTFIIVDTNNRLKYAGFYDVQNKKRVNMPQALIKYINDNKELVCNFKSVHDVISGTITIDGKPMIISARPITDSNFNEPSAGTLIVGRYIDDRIINEAEKIVNSKVKIENISNYKVSNQGINVNGGLYFPNVDNILVKPYNEDMISGYSITNGLDGKPSLMIKMDSKRTIYSQGLRFVSLLILLFITCSALISALCMILLKIFVVIPIEKLSTEVSKLKLTDSIISRIKIDGNDEISSLGIEINNMLEKIEMNNKKVMDSEKQLKLVLEGASAGYWDWNLKENIFDVNEKFLSILGYSKDELPRANELWQRLIHKEDMKYYKEFWGNKIWRTLDINVVELRLLTKSGEHKWVLNQCKAVEYDEAGKPKRMTGIITDISDKKKYEEELKYLNYYDKLTGIFNRGYYEFILDKVDKSGRLPISIIMGDLNGLKVANDTFGYEEGDKLLKEAAEVLKKVCGSDGVVSRYGGDEFIIILEGITKEEADKICFEVKNECKGRKVGAIYLNIALGYSTKTSNSENISDIVKEAEEMMYRNKLLEDRSGRKSIISSLSQVLLEKSNETEEHVDRIYNLCVKISYALSLNTNEINELYLLAKLHDIGKIGIDDKILNKPGKLNEEEWEVMKTHCEIGYRIASSTPDLRHIAYGILTHHERYDGTGYPKGLKGEEIPLLSRVISIVDAFDVMTHDRPYKQAITVGEAIKELRECAGTQFDPNLVEICIQAFQDEVKLEQDVVIYAP